MFNFYLTIVDDTLSFQPAGEDVFGNVRIVWAPTLMPAADGHRPFYTRAGVRQLWDAGTLFKVADVNRMTAASLQAVGTHFKAPCPRRPLASRIA